MKKVLLTLAALAVSTGAMAGPSWTYIDIGYVFGNGIYGVDGDGKFGEDTTGAALRGSFGFGDIWHIQANVSSAEINGGKSKGFGADVTTYGIRAGIHPAVTDNTDFVFDVGYTGSEYKNDSVPGTENKFNPATFDLRTGVRSNIGALELRSFVSWNWLDPDDLGDGTQTVGFSVGGQYNFSDAWAVGVDTQIIGFTSDAADISDANFTDLYVRWSF